MGYTVPLWLKSPGRSIVKCQVLMSLQWVHIQHFRHALLLFLAFVFLILQVSFDLAEYTANVDAVGTLRLLDAIKTCGMENTVRFYQVHAKK